MKKQQDEQLQGSCGFPPNTQSTSSTSNGGVCWSIKTYARLKPSYSASPPLPQLYCLKHGVGDSKSALHTTLKVELPKELLSDAIVNNFRDKFEFNFSGVFGVDTSQEQVYETAAAGVVKAVLDGFNGTIFAYGQTGSGKTFTMTGGEVYAERGVIFRAIQQVFSGIANRSAVVRSKCFVSYLEIYNEDIYDLLEPTDVTGNSFSQYASYGDSKKDLSIVPVDSEEEALNLLFLGNINRTTGRTAMNEASSRSHCIFTIQVESQMVNSGTTAVAKLNLVDLAGSERVHKRNEDDRTTLEGKHINLSLHYLEQVILKLQHQSKGKMHVPYRNSSLTTVLRDSIGGNCQTAVITTLNTDPKFVLETLSSCRFAQRCAQVQNIVRSNTSADIKQTMNRLLRENAELKRELLRLSADKVQCAPSKTNRHVKGRLSSPRRAQNTRRHGEVCSSTPLSQRLGRCLSNFTSLGHGGIKETLKLKHLDEAYKCIEMLIEVLRERDEGLQDEREISSSPIIIPNDRYQTDRIEQKQENSSSQPSNRISEPGTQHTYPQQLHGSGDISYRKKLERESVELDKEQLCWDTYSTLSTPNVAENRSPETHEGVGAEHGRFNSTAYDKQMSVDEAAELQGHSQVSDGHIPLASSSPKNPNVNSLVAQDPVLEERLNRGAVLVKHSRYGRPKARYVWVGPERDSIHWRRIGDQATLGSLALDEVVCVLRGKCTPILRKVESRRDDCMFSVLTASGKSLDFEVDEGEKNADEECSQWVGALSYCLKRHPRWKQNRSGSKGSSSKVLRRISTTAADFFGVQ